MTREQHKVMRDEIISTIHAAFGKRGIPHDNIYLTVMVHTADLPEDHYANEDTGIHTYGKMSNDLQLQGLEVDGE